MKIALRIAIIIAISIGILWTALTIWVDMPSAAVTKEYGTKNSAKKILLIYDADPIYNLDEQLCNAFAKQVAQRGIYAKIVTTKAADNVDIASYDILFLCANTYNWRPDKAIINYIKSHDLNEKHIVALTLGSGSTTESKDKFEHIIQNAGGILTDSKTLWLLRPNDETRMDEKNVDVAINIVQNWAEQIVSTL